MIDCFQSASNPVSASVEDSSNKRIKTETDTCSKFNDLEKNEFYQGKRLKKKKMHLQKRGMQLFKQCFKYIKKQHPNLLKEEVHDIMNGIYDKK
jgi:hypothetical protein